MHTKAITEQISVLIVDDNKDLCEFVTQSLATGGRFQVTGAAHDGIRALELLSIYEPEVLLLDIVLPFRDGLFVLEEIKSLRLKNKPIIIMLTSVSNEHVMQRAIDLGADFFIIKPFDINSLSKRIEEVYFDKKKNTQVTYNLSNEQSQKKNLNKTIEGFLLESGISVSLKGNAYLKSAIVFCLTHEEASLGLTKVVYPQVAKEYNTDAANVERAIRHAIQSAWEKGRIQKFFNENKIKMVDEKRPKSGDFIKIAISYISD